MKKALKYILLVSLVVLIVCVQLLFWEYIFRDKKYSYHVYYKTKEIFGRSIITVNYEIDCNAALVAIEEHLKDISGFDPNDQLIVVSWKELER